MTDFTKQVGWSPSVPASPASITVATDNGDGTGTITNPDGSTVPFCLKCVEPVTYTWAETNGVDGDGVVVWTAAGSDGSTQDITIAEPTVDTNTIFIGQSIVDGTLIQTLTDVDGNPLPNIETDMTSLISKGLIAGDGIVITTDASTGERTISSSVVDTNTNTTYVLSENAAGDTVLTDSNGVSQIVSDSDTDISANKLEWDSATSSFKSTVTEGAADVIGLLAISDEVRKCGDKVLTVDPDTGGLVTKPLKRPALTKVDIVKSPFAAALGAAVDIIYASGVIHNVALTSQPFADETCYDDVLIATDVRMGSWKIYVENPRDEWHWQASNSGDVHHTMLSPQVVVNGTEVYTGVRAQTEAQISATDHNIVAAGTSHVTNYSLNWDKTIGSFTPNPLNRITSNTSSIVKMRQEVNKGV